MTSDAPAVARKKRRPSLFSLVISGFALGVACGVFFGEHVAFLKIAGDVYIGLLQMTVLPYVVVSLTLQLGRLSYEQVGRIALRAGVVLVVLWGVGLVSILHLPMTFPDWPAASFFSVALTQPPPPVDFVDLYVPSNPFYALANAVVPGVVLFSLGLGAALIAVQQKGAVLDVLTGVADAIMRLTHWIVGLAPIGVFALTASAAGTIRLDELARFQVFLWSMMAMGAFLMFWAWPMAATMFTPVRYRELFYHTRSALVTAFATGSLLVVIPMLAERLKRLLEAHESSPHDAEMTVDLLVPTVYNLPNTSMLITVGFGLFAAWFSGSPLSAWEYPTLASIGTFTAFGGTNISVPFVLDFYQLPADLFQLFLVSDTLAGRFWTSLAALFIAVLCVLVVFSIEGRLRISPGKVVAYVMSSTALAVLIAAVLGFVLQRVIPYEYEQYDALVNMQIMETSEHSAVSSGVAPPLARTDLERPRLDVVRERGILRVGYLRDRLPFAFRNSEGALVGLDVQLAHALGGDLGVQLEFSQVEGENLAESLSSGRIDIVMSGLAMSPSLAETVDLSRSYMDLTLALIVEDHRRHDFANTTGAFESSDLRIAVPDTPYSISHLRQLFPNAELVSVDSPRGFFREQLDDVDALVYSAEAGSAWTLVYPDYSVVIPQPVTTRVPLAYQLPKGETAFRDYLDLWLELKVKDGTFDRYHQRWILGKGPSDREPRWSVIRDVLHWVS
jgi:Na+/H+-dicarboxylate symporter/ABC-type amino acid transport substrate-binding protein